MHRGLRQLCISFWTLVLVLPALNSTGDLLSQVQLNIQIHMGSPWIVERTEAFLGVGFSCGSNVEDLILVEGRDQ